MINSETKTKLFSELEKTGNIALSCSRVGIGRATFYYWFNNDSAFRKKAEKVLKHGRDNINDYVENALIAKATKDKDLGAMKYWLSHNDKRYKTDRLSEAHIHHSRTIPPPDPQQPTMEDFIQRVEKMSQEIAEDMVKEYIDEQQSDESGDDIVGPLGP